MDAHDKRISYGIAQLLLQYPFYGSILLRLRVQKSNINTFATDGRRLIYDPKFLDTITAKELAGCLMHEATHVAALHPLRKGARKNHMGWNICCDKEVNEVVVNMEKMTLPEGTVPGEPGLAEAHYQKMMDNTEPCGGCGGKESHLPQPDGTFSPECGAGWCNVLSPELVPGESAEDVEAEIKGNIRQAITTAEMWGKVPAGMESIIAEYFAPKIKWQDVLRQFVETVYEPTIEWSSPRRRYLHQGIILPGPGRRPGIAEVALAVDTSGSMTGDILTQAVSEVRSVIDECYSADVTIPVIWFDTAAYVDYVSGDEELVPKGGGGTRFAAVMEAYAEEEMTQSGLVIITDGYCGDFGAEPAVPVLWVVFGDYAKEFAPPFGEVIELRMEA